ncbi:MAG: hypothetical protein LBM08_00380, partial [Dysgonamonadaceae bacterium]|nr:hypothetical protein [Dysgonamonadaceae bacterium]
NNKAIPEQGSNDPSERTLSLDVLHPAFTFESTTTNHNNVPRNTDVSYEIPIKVTNGVDVQSMTLTLAKTRYITLSDFKWGDNSIPDNAIDITETAVTIQMTEDIIGNVINSIPRNLTFKAQASVSSIHEIKIRIDHPVADACYTINPFITLSFNIPTINSGQAKMQLYDTDNYFTTNPQTGDPMPAAFDGIHPNYVRQRLKNTGQTDIAQIRICVNAMGLRSAGRGGMFLDEESKIYYSITASEDVPSPEDIFELDKTAANWTCDTLFVPYVPFVGALKQEYANKHLYSYFTIPEEIPKLSVLHVFVPVIRGDIVDASDWDVFPHSVVNVQYGNYACLIQLNKYDADNSWDENGNGAFAIDAMNSNNRLNFARFQSIFSDAFLVAGQSQQMIATFDYNSQPDNLTKYGTTTQRYVHYIRLPEYLEIEGSTAADRKNYIKIGATVLPASNVELLPSSDPDYKPEYNTYSFIVAHKHASGSLNVTYRAKPANNGTNGGYDYEGAKSGTIYYWVHWNPGYEETIKDNKDLLLPFKYVAKNSARVTVVEQREGVMLNLLNINRLTRGLKVKGSSGADNRTPDDGELATFSAINNNVYLLNDTGRLEVNIETMAGDYRYMYVLLESASMPRFTFEGFNNLSFPDTYTYLQLNGQIVTPDQVSTGTGNDSTKVYLRFPATVFGGYFPPYAGNLSLKFKATTENLVESKPLQVSVYMAENGVSNPFAPTSAERAGYESLSTQWQVQPAYGSNWRAESTAHRDVATITTYSANVGLNYFGTYSPVYPTESFAFPNEYRPYRWPKKVTVVYPTGMTPKNLILTSGTHVDITSTSASGGHKSLTLKHSLENPEITQYADSVVYEYDISGLFVQASNYDEAKQARDDGKWILPDDVFQIFFSADVECSPLVASSGEIPIRFTSTLRDEFTEEFTYLQNHNPLYFYNGLQCNLNISELYKNITAYSSLITIPTLSVELFRTGESSYPCWLYIEGESISNITLTASSSTLTATGNWIALGNLDKVNTYALSYLAGNLANAGIKVHFICDYTEDGIDPTEYPSIAEFLAADADNEKYLMDTETITVTASTDSRIKASLTLPLDPINYNVDYTVSIQLASTEGSADLINPQLTINLPVGQNISDVQYEYPPSPGYTSLSSGTDYSINNNQLIINTSALNNGAGIVLKGSREAAGGSDLLNLNLIFTPDCNTPLTSFRLSGTASGTRIVGTNVSSSFSTNNSILPNIPLAYNFTLETPVLFSNNYAFGGNTTNDSLVIAVEKVFGANNISDKDHLLLQLPECFSIDGNAVIHSTAIPSVEGATFSVVKNGTTVTQGGVTALQYTVLLPSGALNSLTNKGENDEFTYSIPIKYVQEDAPAALMGVTVSCITEKSFGSCSNYSDYALDSKNSAEIVPLKIESSNPYTYNMICRDEPAIFSLTSCPPDFNGAWYSDESLQSESVLPTENNIYTYNSPSEGVETVYVDAKISNTSYGKVHIDIKTPPDDMYWRKDAAGTDWRNPANWALTSDGTSNPNGYLPTPCTHVILPTGASAFYPILQDSVVCSMITFNPGAELGRQDLLVYDNAHMQLNLAANQWYMFSPPLHNMYSGDFYREDPDPSVDEQTAYTVRFSLINPETAFDQTGQWTGAFSTPNVELGIGSGLAIWIDKHGTSANERPEILFDFPKHDTEHHLYNPDRFPPGNISKTYPIDRSQNGRFIHEGVMDGQGNIALPISGAGGEAFSSVLIGNPFMSHLNFTAFHADNSGLYSKGYKLVHGAGAEIDGFYSYMWNGSGNKYISTDPDGESSGLIPPMQSFVVEVSNGTASLNANIQTHTATSVEQGDAFRDAGTDASSSSRQLDILAVRNTEVSKAIILQDASYATHYIPSEDSYKLFVSKVYDSDDVLKHVQLYTRSSDGYALDINCIGTGEQDITIPLCIRTSEKGEITLNFSGMESFGESTGIYLYDAQHPQRLIDLKTQPEYAFNKTEDELYLENRLSLVIGKTLQPLGIETDSQSSGVRILSLSPHTLRIVSASGDVLGNVRITDAWGRIVLDNPTVSSSTYEYQTPAPGIYVVRVGAEVKKVVSIR